MSAAANIAEGAGRDSKREFAHFPSNAQGSASELAAELLIAHRLAFLSEDNYGTLGAKLDSIGRMIGGLSRQVREKLSS